jgi:hypothetical protein
MKRGKRKCEGKGEKPKCNREIEVERIKINTKGTKIKPKRVWALILAYRGRGGGTIFGGGGGEYGFWTNIKIPTTKRDIISKQDHKRRKQERRTMKGEGR